MWEGDGAKMESPGFYLHFQKDKLMLGGGIHAFTRDQLPRFREAVDDRKRGRELKRIFEKGARAFPDCRAMGMEDYKRVPRGYPQDHPRADLLRMKGAVLGEEGPLPAALFSARLLDYAYRRYEKMKGLHDWLKATLSVA